MIAGRAQLMGRTKRFQPRIVSDAMNNNPPIWAEIERVHANFSRVETIKRFFLIEQQLTPEDEELTPTMKLKRSFVNKRYAAEIDAMYGDRAVA